MPCSFPRERGRARFYRPTAKLLPPAHMWLRRLPGTCIGRDQARKGDAPRSWRQVVLVVSPAPSPLRRPTDVQKMPHRCPRWSLTWRDSLHASGRGSWHLIPLVSALGDTATDSPPWCELVVAWLVSEGCRGWSQVAGLADDLLGGSVADRSYGPQAGWMQPIRGSSV